MKVPNPGQRQKLRALQYIPVSYTHLTFLDGKFTFYFKGDLEEERLALIRHAEEIDFQMDSDHCIDVYKRQHI